MKNAIVIFVGIAFNLYMLWVVWNSKSLVGTGHSPLWLNLFLSILFFLMKLLMGFFLIFSLEGHLLVDRNAMISVY